MEWKGRISEESTKQNKKIKELEEELQHLKQVRFAFFSKAF